MCPSSPTRPPRPHTHRPPPTYHEKYIARCTPPPMAFRQMPWSISGGRLFLTTAGGAGRGFYIAFAGRLGLAEGALRRCSLSRYSRCVVSRCAGWVERRTHLYYKDLVFPASCVDSPAVSSLVQIRNPPPPYAAVVGRRRILAVMSD